MQLQANPWQAPVSPPAAEPAKLFWQDRRFEITAAAMPSSAYLLSRYSITIDDGQPFTSRQIRLNEHFEFEFEHQGRMVSALFETCGLVMEGEKYRLTIGGKHVFEGQMTVEHWWKSQFFGVLTGMTIGISGLGLAWFLF